MEEKLIKKLEKEMEQFKDKIRLEGVEYAIDRAYELTVKQEIIDVLTFDKKPSNVECKFLMSRENLLEELYDGWITSDGNLRADLEYSVDETIEKISKDYKKENKQNYKNNKERER